MAKTETVNKTQAVKQTMGKLGKDAPAEAVIAKVKEEFGHDLSKSHYFNIKSTLNKKGKKRGRPRKVQTEDGAAVAASPAPKVRQAINLTDIATIKHLAERYGPQSIHSLIELVGK